MKIYLFDVRTREYLGEGAADLSPEDVKIRGTRVRAEAAAAGQQLVDEDLVARTLASPEVWLIPGNATHVAPPAVAEGHVALWDGREWSEAEDLRGEWFDREGASTLIDMPGVRPPEGAVRSPRPSSRHALMGGEWVLDPALPPPPSPGRRAVDAILADPDALEALRAALALTGRG